MVKFADISPATGNLVGRLCGTLLYGVNVMVFSTCMYVLAQRRSKGMGVPWFILVGTTAQFLVATIHVGNSWRMLIEAFIWNAQIPNASFNYWVDDPRKPTEVITKLLPIINSGFADIVLIWRLYVIWDRHKLICIIPIITVVAYTITYLCGIVKLVSLTGNNFFVISQYFVAGLIMSATTHASVTCLVAGKIWWNTRGIISAGIYHSGTRPMSVFWTVIESGAIYSISVIIAVVFAALKTQAGGFLVDIIIQLSGIIPTLIIVRAGLGLTFDFTEPTLTTHPMEFHIGLKATAARDTLVAESSEACNVSERG